MTNAIRAAVAGTSRSFPTIYYPREMKYRMSMNAQICPTQQHRFHTLDGMRGIAALIVVAGHAGLWLHPLPAAHIWLAVDLFFVLSGFVLARAYEPKFARGLSGGSFMKQRYVRLYPLYFLGVSLGILSALLALVAGRGHLSAASFALATVSGLLLLPCPSLNAQDPLVPFNPPGWSLIFELLVNAAYAFLWKRLSNRVLWVVTIICAVALVGNYLAGLPLGGTHLGDALAGIPRVGYSFTIGVLIARYFSGEPVTSRWSWPLILSIVPLLFVLAPMTATMDTSIQLFAMPLLVLIGAKIEPRRPNTMAMLGTLSYPIYALHFPMLVLLKRVGSVVGFKSGSAAPWSGIAILFAICGFILLLERYFDRPARAWLGKFAAPHSPMRGYVRTPVPRREA